MPAQQFMMYLSTMLPDCCQSVYNCRGKPIVQSHDITEFYEGGGGGGDTITWDHRVLRRGGGDTITHAVSQYHRVLRGEGGRGGHN